MAKKTRPKTGKKSVTVHMDRVVFEALSRAAKERSCSLASVIRVAVNEKLEEVAK